MVAWVQSNNARIREHEAGIRSFLAGTLPAATDAADGFATGLRGGLSLTAHLVSGAALMFVSLLCISPAGDAIWRWIQGAPAPAIATGWPSRAPPPGAQRAATSAHRARGVTSAPDPRRSKSSRARPLSHSGDPDRPHGRSGDDPPATSSGRPCDVFPSARCVPVWAGIVGDPRASRVAAIGAHEAADPVFIGRSATSAFAIPALFASRRSPVRSRLAPSPRSPMPSRICDIRRTRDRRPCSTILFPRGPCERLAH
jgi:hypothetical protein